MKKIAIRRQLLTELTTDDLSEVAGGISGLLCLTRVPQCYYSYYGPCQPPPTDYCQ